MVTALGFHGRRATDTNPTRSNSSSPREAENRERPKSGQPSNTSSNSADCLQPAKSQQTDATSSDFPGSRQAGTQQFQEIRPYNGRQFDPVTGTGEFKTVICGFQSGSGSSASSAARPAARIPRREMAQIARSSSMWYGLY